MEYYSQEQLVKDIEFEKTALEHAYDSGKVSETISRLILHFKTPLSPLFISYMLYDINVRSLKKYGHPLNYTHFGEITFSDGNSLRVDIDSYKKLIARDELEYVEYLENGFLVLKDSFPKDTFDGHHLSFASERVIDEAVKHLPDGPKNIHTDSVLEQEFLPKELPVIQLLKEIYKNTYKDGMYEGYVEGLSLASVFPKN